MEVTNVLVTGMSGTGKSSALAELGRRGYRVVDTDEPFWTEWVESPEEVGGGQWLWIEGRMTTLLRSNVSRTLFVQGCVQNQGKFYDRFDAVVLLTALLVYEARTRTTLWSHSLIAPHE
jgi:predicted ATPase